MTENTEQRCPVITTDASDPNRKIVIVPEENADALTEKERVDYYDHRKRFLLWLLNVGKEPEQGEGYSPYTVVNTGYKTAQFDRAVWCDYDRYKFPPTSDDAARYFEDVIYRDISNRTKAKHKECLERYFRWLSQHFDVEAWESEASFSSSGGGNNPRDYLSKEERHRVRQAALRHGDIPAYDNLDAEDRNRWESYVARVLDKPAEDISKAEWQQVDGWKITSMVYVSLDIGLRPVEVGRAKVPWFNTDEGVVVIPKSESAKNSNNWRVPITEQTANVVDRWLQERQMYDRYAESDRMWLTNHGNPYGSKSLRGILLTLCEDAGINTTHRSISWYSIRHSVGTMMTGERDLAATKKVLRHEDTRTTMKYDQVPDDELRDAMNKMG